MKPFLLMKIILNMNTISYLKEIDIFDFSKFNDLINGLDRLSSNIVSTINSIHDTCEYFCNSFVSLKYSISLIETVNEEERNYYWVLFS